MSAGASAGAGAAAAAAVIQATRASGVIVQIDPADFCWIIERNSEPLVVHTFGGFFTKTHRYLTSYRGLAFYTKSPRELQLPSHCQWVEAKSIWIPGQ